MDKLHCISITFLSLVYFKEGLFQGAIIRVLTYRIRYANITVCYLFVFSHAPRRYAELLLSAYLITFCWYHMIIPSIPNPTYSIP